MKENSRSRNKLTNVEEILPGLYKIELPLPVPSLNSVFAYLVRDNDENLLIDTGWNYQECYEALKSAFSEVRFDIPDLQKIIVSHLHPDHFGLSARLKKEAPSSVLMMHEKDALRLHMREKRNLFLNEIESWLRMHGMPEKDLRELNEFSAGRDKYFNPAPPDKLLQGGEKINVGTFTFEVIHAPGHTKGNICLYETAKTQVFFSGDHVLPRITPNISLTPNYDGDPLGEYLESIQSLKDIKTNKVLPSHEYVFDSLTTRLNEIEKHHQERLADTMAAMGESQRSDGRMSAYEIALRLHWQPGSLDSLSAWQKRAAIMETLAHLEYLKRKRRITEVEVSEENNDMTKKVYYSRIIS